MQEIRCLAIDFLSEFIQCLESHQKEPLLRPIMSRTVTELRVFIKKRGSYVEGDFVFSLSAL
jgi:hypothetical protein